jgi:hypothetical protein
VQDLGWIGALPDYRRLCRARVEDIEEPTVQEIRYLDKLSDELAKEKAIEKILRK